MVNVRPHQQLPRNGPRREALRGKGQFWTPDWVAQAMVAYVLYENATDHLYDAGVGAGAFLVAAKRVAADMERRVRLLGCDVDVGVVQQINGLTQRELQGIEIRDFIKNPPQRTFRAIVSNPPYIRHHRISRDDKDFLAAFAYRLLEFRIDGRAGYHIYFLLQALRLLEPGGKLAFIMPADTCEGVFSGRLWRWITKQYCLEGVVTFDRDATPFPGVDTNAVVFLIRNTKPDAMMTWIRCLVPDRQALTRMLVGGLRDTGDAGLSVVRRSLDEALATGLSREPRARREEYTLGDFARVMRGVVTGANEFFFLTRERARELGIPDRFLRRAIGRTRDVDGDEISTETLDVLERKGRPTFLFNPNGYSRKEMPPAVQSYLSVGERMGLPSQPLIATRKPWYRMEERIIPPFLFAYLGRRNVRFIRNTARIVPLTAFLCVYPRSNDPRDHEKLWRILQYPETVANLRFVGKSYGSGAIKVEPRALERLPISAEVMDGIALESVGRVPSLFAPEIAPASAMAEA